MRADFRPQSSGLPRLARSKAAGFTLLEAIVALTLFAMIGMSAYGLINSNLISLERARAAARTAQAVSSALSYLEAVNPAHQPEGSTSLGSITMHWQSTHLREPKDGSGHPAGVSLYEIGLHLTHVQLIEDQNLLYEFDLRQVGYQQVRSLRDGNAFE